MSIFIAGFILTYTAHLASTSALPQTLRQRERFRTKVEQSPKWIHHGELPKHHNLDYIDVSRYENTPFRRIKFYDFDDESPVVKQKKRVIKKVKNFESVKKFDKLFDKNGMLYLTQPVDIEDRKLNRLMNKIVQYKMDLKKNKFLRKPLTKVFRPDEIRRLKKIVRALDEEPDTMRTEFEFSELVQ